MIKCARKLIISAFSALVFCPAARSDDASRAPTAPAQSAPADLVKRVLEITDAVLEHHVDPPARQQMILEGVKALYRKTGQAVPPGLSRRISNVAKAEQITALLAEIWPRSAAGTGSADALEQAMIDGLLQSIPGEARVISAKDRRVEEQIAGNRYVGLHIGLGMDEKEQRPKIAEVMEGGPADRAGVKQGDLIEQIDGVDTKGMKLREAVNRLRGDEGTYVTINVRQPKAPDARTYKIARGQLPRMTVCGARKRTSGGWDVRLDGPDPIGYLKITDITASTPHELRKLASQLESDGARALVLDLRALRSPGLSAENLHSTVLLADAFLGHGCIGRVKSTHGETTYQADSDALFQDRPLAVLIDGETGSAAEWLAAALQDNHRAVLVGTPSSSAWGVPAVGVHSAIPVGDGAWSVILTTGQLERGDGRPLAPDAASAPAGARNLVQRLHDASEAAKIFEQLAAQAASPKESTKNAAGGQAIKQSALGPNSKFGVRPDHMVSRPAPRGTTAPRNQASGNAQDLAMDSDKLLAKAVQLLGEALKKN